MNIRVFIVDDHPVTREGLRSAIEARSGDIQVVGEASNGMVALEAVGKVGVDIYILDVSMPVLNGIETMQRLFKKEARSKVIILSVHDSRAIVEKAFLSGAHGYLLKESAIDEVIQAIHEVSKGRYYVSPAISGFLIHGFLVGQSKANGRDALHPHSALTLREREVIQLIAEGMTAKEVASKLGLSLNTALVHRKNIMQKLGLHKQADLVRYAIKEGISEL
jgi:DNA-binding NarL/FixJ family response regulator